jgi:hypothetical protein
VNILLNKTITTVVIKIILEQVSNYCYDHASLGNLALYVNQPFTIMHSKHFPEFGNFVNGVVKPFKGDQGHVLSILRDSNDELFVCYRTSRYAKTRGEASKEMYNFYLPLLEFFDFSKIDIQPATAYDIVGRKVVCYLDDVSKWVWGMVLSFDTQTYNVQFNENKRREFVTYEQIKCNICVDVVMY